MAEQERSKEGQKGPDSQELKKGLESRLEDIETLSRGPKRAAGGGGAPDTGAKWMDISTPPRLVDMAMAARQMSTLLDAGIPLLQSLRILKDRSQHPHLKRVFGDVAGRVERGETLSSGLAAHPRVFSRLFVGVAKIGESAGILDKSIRRLAEIMEQRVAIRRQIGAAIAYPVVALCIAFVILLLVFGLAIPKFAAIYEGQKVELPGITQFILGVSAIVRGYYWLYLPLLVILIVALILWKRTPGGRRVLDALCLRLPVIGPIGKKIHTARSARTLGNLLEAGIPLLESLALTSGTAENWKVAVAIARVRESVERGGKIEPPLRESNVFPPLAVDMMAIGDEAGSLEFMLKKIADNYESEVESTLRGISSIIEPVLIVFLGFIVLMIALGALLPYFNLIGVVGVE